MKGFGNQPRTGPTVHRFTSRGYRAPCRSLAVPILWGSIDLGLIGRASETQQTRTVVRFSFWGWGERRLAAAMQALIGNRTACYPSHGLASTHIPQSRRFDALGRQLPWSVRCQAAATRETLAEVAGSSVKTSASELPAPRSGTLAEGATAYVEELRIRSYEVDPQQRTTMVTVANLIQVRATHRDKPGTVGR